MTDKHQRVKQSLKLCGIDGEFDEPLGCSSPGWVVLELLKYGLGDAANLKFVVLS